MRTRSLIILVSAMMLVGAACGGGDDDDAVEIDLEAIAAVDPCELLDEATASDLAGGDVERVDDDEVGEGEAGCRYDFAEGGVASGLAAAMRLEPGDEGDVPGSSLARAVSLGDGGAVEATDTDVKVVYVVREIVVRIEVVPASGDVSDELVDQVVEFAETTEAPIVEAVTGEEVAATTTSEATTTTEAATTTSTDVTIEQLWARTATEFREQVGEQFDYDCPAGGSPRTVWGGPETGYTDDSSVCTAAVHFGVITIEEGGEVRIQMIPGQSSYTGSERNGIVSQDWPEWPGAFLVLGDPEG